MSTVDYESTEKQTEGGADLTNTPLLNDYIKKAGYKKTFLAESIGVSRQGFTLKCNNKAEFKAKEIEILCQILDIGVKDRMAIFFAK